MFDAWPRNAFALRKLQKELADSAGLKLGVLTTVSHSAHVYENSWNAANEILEEHYPKRVAFEEDPRGNFIISIEGGKVVVEHAMLAGKTGKKIEGSGIKEVLDKLVLQNLVSRPEHWVYLGKEIQNAFDCMRSGKQYVQDVA
jgi:thymidylate synthase